MSDATFQELKEFDDATDANLALHYANLLICVEKNMIYNIDTGKRIPRRVFNQMVKDDQIGQYSTNPAHPVCGDLSDYHVGLGKDIVEFGQRLDLLVSNLIFTIEQLDDGLMEFAQSLYFISPELLQALRVHPYFRPMMSKRELWEELIRFSAEVKGAKSKIPACLHIDRFYMKSVLNSMDTYHENISTTTSELEMEGLVIDIASEQEFGIETAVFLHRGDKTHLYMVTLGREVGYEFELQAE
jgi:hypothetical protein